MGGWYEKFFFKSAFLNLKWPKIDLEIYFDQSKANLTYLYRFLPKKPDFGVNIMSVGSYRKKPRKVANTPEAP